MTDDNINQLKTDDLIMKRLAKLMALRCFRNTELENLHAGIVPHSEAGDFSDVKVVSPSSEIPWTRLSRLSDQEMRSLMIDVVNQCYTFLDLLYRNPHGDELIESLRREDPLPQWAEPKVQKTYYLKRSRRAGSPRS